MVVSFYFVAFTCHTLKAGLGKYCLTLNLGAKKGTTDLYIWTIYDAVCVQGCKKKCFSPYFSFVEIGRKKN